MEQLPLAVKLTVRPDEAVALTVKSASPNVLLPNGLNAIVWFPTLFVSAKFTVARLFARLATTLYGPPAIPFAVNVGAVATPLPFVFTVDELENTPLAPLAGGVKVTGTL